MIDKGVFDMKRNEYDKLVQQAREARSIYGLMMASGMDDEDEEFEEAKNAFEKYKSEIDEILTVDMQSFIESFMSVAGKKGYVLEKIIVEGDTIYIAKPKDMETQDNYKLLLEQDGVFVLGKNDKKVMSHPEITVKGVSIPTVSIRNVHFSYIYPCFFSKDIHEKYSKFAKFMEKWEDAAIKDFKKKQSNKR